MARAVQYSAGPAYGEQGYDVCDEFAEPEAAILYPLWYEKWDYRGGTAGAVFDERILFPDDHKKCEVERRTVVEGASADQIQIIKVQIINYRDRNKSVPF